MKEMKKKLKTKYAEENVPTKMHFCSNSMYEGVPVGCHIVFVLDQSGSMGFFKGQPWKYTEKSFDAFIQQRFADQGLDDMVSVIQFDDTAEVVCEYQLISSASMARMRGGGTQFHPAAVKAKEIFSKHADEKRRPVPVMMTDGGSSG